MSHLWQTVLLLMFAYSVNAGSTKFPINQGFRGNPFVTSIEPGRTSIIDGWGIHYIPGRGTTYNLWGFGCVKLSLGRKAFRIGSDDVDNLVAFLRRKSSQLGSPR